MADMTVLIPLDQLHPHPDNPRLEADQELVERLAARIREQDFDAAHPLVVRPFGDGYQILAGHTRALAARKAGIKTVPCVVRHLDDRDAYMLLLLDNDQLGVSNLERGRHFNRSGMGSAEYAKAAGVTASQITYDGGAAEVFEEVLSQLKPEEVIALRTGRNQHLYTIKTEKLPEWLRVTFVRRMLSEGWNVDAARQQARRFKDLPKTDDMPSWADLDAIGAALLDGTLRPGDVARMVKVAETASARIEQAGFNGTDYQQELMDRLEGERPASISAVQTIADVVTNAQADAKRKEEQKQEAERRSRMAAEERALKRAALLRKAVTLKQWIDLDPDTRAMLLNLDPTTVPRRSFNDEKSLDVEWAMKTHNPLTGCRHDCPYCYARDIAERFRTDLPELYPEGFEPTFHPEQLLTPRFNRPPKESERDARHKNVFLCSMADLYGRWNPAEWIEAILRECDLAPWWNFLCLTKFPKRMAAFEVPSNVWMGTTVDLQARVAAAEAGFARVNSKVRWLSVEPMLEPLRFKRLDLFQWVVIGGASKSSRTPAWRPPFPWIADLVTQAREAGCKVYFKSNLVGVERKNLKKDFPESDKPGQDYIGGSRVLELPFDAPVKADPVEAPAVFHYLKGGKAGAA
jgi:ParB/RepB/Spo0J family partition protein